LFDLSIETLLGRVIGIVLGFALHEWAHAYTAYRLGDNTAYNQGRLTVDPRAHIDPLGLMLAFVVGFGWAKPVPVNPRAFYPNEKRGLMIVSLAGPLMNLAIAVLFGVLIHLIGGMGDFITNVLGAVVLFNLVLFVFNLLPFSPLDGYKIAVGVLPAEQSYQMVRHERDTTLILLVLLMLGAISWGRFDPLWTVLGPPLRFLYHVLV